MADSARTPSVNLRIAVLYCQHSVSVDAAITAACERAAGFSVQAVLMPCSSKVQASHLLKILDDGCDGVEVIACPAAACRFLVGSTRAEKRVAYVRQLLDRVHLGSDRVGLTRGSGLSAESFMSIVAARAEAVKLLETGVNL